MPLWILVNAFKSAAQGYGIEKRVLLLHGPVGSSKSTIARLLKKGLERYSTTDDGALYTLGWVDRGRRRSPVVPDERGAAALDSRAVSRGSRATAQRRAVPPGDYRVKITGELCPFCRFMYSDRLKKYDGDWTRVIQDVRVKRLLLSEKDRIGIGTFQPKDEKNQDSTELTGDINYRKIAEYGSDSDPRAFNFDGEFNIANRGMVEFVEVLKLDVAFLYDLLGASQEHKVKPKKFAQTDIDEVILGHTNEPEYRRLQNNEFMEALRDRTVKIDVPYVTTLADEIKIYEKDYNKNTVRGQAHRAAHDRNGRDVGRAHAARRAQERRPVAAAKAEALQRQDAARLHRRQHQGAPRADDQRGHARHLAPLRAGQDLQRPGGPPGGHGRSIRSWCSTSSKSGLKHHTPDHQRGDDAASIASCWAW